MTPQGFLDFAAAFLKTSRPFILRTLAEGIGAKIKADSSVVTEADVGTEKLFRAYITEHYPEHGVLGEEFGHSNPDAPYQWVIDPIDGTAEFARGLPLYGSIFGLFHNQQPLAGIMDFPSLDETYSAAKGCGAFRNGVRLDLSKHAADSVALNCRIGASPPWNFIRKGGNLKPFESLMRSFPNLRIYHSCYSQALAACGGVDASVEWNLSIWDLAAAQIIVEEAGGAYIILEKPENWASGYYRVVLGSKQVAEEVAKAVR